MSKILIQAYILILMFLASNIIFLVPEVEPNYLDAVETAKTFGKIVKKHHDNGESYYFIYNL